MKEKLEQLIYQYQDVSIHKYRKLSNLHKIFPLQNADPADDQPKIL